MTDYYPLISRAIAGLEKNTDEQRGRLYEHARMMLLRQLSKMRPPRTASETISERLALEEAIRKAEAEATRRLREVARLAAQGEGTAKSNRRWGLGRK